MTWLEYNDALQEVPFDSELIVGTGAQATWRLRRADLMPRHFIVTATPEGAHIRPFSGDAVVSVNGHQLSSGTTPLNDGDIINAGSGLFRFWAAVPSETRTQLPVPPLAAGYLVDGGRPAASLNRTSTGIGRDDSNGLVIEDASSFEAEIRREAGGHALHACSSSNVRVNGKPVSSPVLLTEGDEIQIGSRLFRYTREPQIEAAAEVPIARASETLELDLTNTDDDEVYASTGSHPAAVTLRNPMRAVAFVSSVIAAVAIATLVFMHRGP